MGPVCGGPSITPATPGSMHYSQDWCVWPWVVSVCVCRCGFVWVLDPAREGREGGKCDVNQTGTLRGRGTVSNTGS